MDCHTFENLLADYVSGKLAPAEYARAESHATECISCRCLVEIAQGNLDLMPEDGKKDLTRLILARTSGGACARAQDLLCDFVDDLLPREDADLVSQHVDNCPACRHLAGVLSELKEILPRMAEVQPDEKFTEEVMRSTLGLRPAPRPGLRARLREWWLRAAQRPRFSLEAAYAGTLLMVLFLGNPFPSMQALSVRALDMVSKVVAGGIEKREPAVLGAVKEFAIDLSASEQGVRSSMEQARRRGEIMVASSVDYQFRAAQTSWSRGKRAVQDFWQRLWSGKKPDLKDPKTSKNL